MWASCVHTKKRCLKRASRKHYLGHLSGFCDALCFLCKPAPLKGYASDKGLINGYNEITKNVRPSDGNHQALRSTSTNLGQLRWRVTLVAIPGS